MKCQVIFSLEKHTEKNQNVSVAFVICASRVNTGTTTSGNSSKSITSPSLINSISPAYTGQEPEKFQICSDSLDVRTIGMN